MKRDGAAVGVDRGLGLGMKVTTIERSRRR